MSYTVSTQLSRMDPELKATWVKALRSGEFEQARSKLHRKIDGQDSYCCYGVLCTLVPGLNVTKSPPFNYRGNDYASTVKYNGEGSFIPNAVALAMFPKEVYTNDLKFDIAYSKPDDPYFENHRRDYWISHLNDGGFTFAQIADLINYLW